MREKLCSKRMSLKNREPWDLKNLFIIMSQYTYISLPTRTNSRIFNPLERYLGMLNRGCRESHFSWEMGSIEMIPEPTMRRCTTSTPRKRCEIIFLSRDLLKISIWSSLWISLLVIGDHKVYKKS